MTYEECLAYLFQQLPVYQRVGAAAYKVDLNNTIALCRLLGHPERNFKSVHVAGTNGKGSTSHILSAVMQSAGYKTGLYTSPHLVDFRERIRINGQMISEEEVVSFVLEWKDRMEAIRCSFFEWTVALAFHYFSEQQVDIAIIETGLGGRLDSTNVIQPEVSVITNIGMDHMQFLGDTLEAIAGEKAGIIKEQTPVVIGETQEEIKHVFLNKSQQLNAPMVFADQQSHPEYPTDLKGSYQLKNIKTALSSIEVLQQKGWKIGASDIRKGLSNVARLSGLTGRWQRLRESPTVLADTAHNKEGVSLVMTQLAAQSFDRLHIVWGMVNDKSAAPVFDLLPDDAEYYFCQAQIPRAMPLENLLEIAVEKGKKGKGYDSVNSAYNAALAAAQDGDLIYVGGSTFVVAEVL